MKKFGIYIAASALLTVGSCSKDLDQVPFSSATTATFYSQPSDFVDGVNAVYADLRSFPDRQLNLSETRSDNLYAVSDGGVRDWEGINSFHKTIAANPYVTEAWETNFNGIYRANIVLEQLAENGDVIPDASLKARLEGEARFLRAFFYFDLIRWFGDVPIADKAVTANEALDLPRSPVAEVYQLVISDLQFAAANLPVSYTASNAGRATSNAAKAYLALVYMTRSGPAYGINGPGMGLNEWNEALALINEVIATNKFSFLPTYAEIFNYDNEHNAEVIFNVEYITGASPVLGGTFPWVLVPDDWFKSVGQQVQGGLTIRPVSQDLLTSYEAGDIRKDFSITEGYTNNGVTNTNPFFTKFVDLSHVPANRVDWPINFIAMRYTDLLMMKAECILNGASGTQGEVDDIVNMVRNRAGLGSLSNVTKDQLFEERRHEFAAEGLRWHDLVRSGMVETTITNWIAAEDAQNAIQPFTANYIIYPVPQSQLDVKSGLYTQNPGY